MKAIVALSGGMDSTTVLAKALEMYDVVMPVAFSYGSKHNPYENKAAQALVEHYHLDLRSVDLSGVMAGFRSNLMADGGDVPEGHYESDSMALTVVPGRNIIFAAILAGLAWSEKAEAVILGIHSGDHAIYPDCRPEFYEAMRLAIKTGTGNRVSLEAPYLHGSKITILTDGMKMGVPYEKTRTCYKDQEIACGKCGACQERLEAFRMNHIDDPLEYEYRGVLMKGE